MGLVSNYGAGKVSRVLDVFKTFEYRSIHVNSDSNFGVALSTQMQFYNSVPYSVPTVRKLVSLVQSDTSNRLRAAYNFKL
jgi:hypothetical protein